jgi:DNA-binding response OmpR family regulator/DNA-binding CsgD family transcriptional regulator
MNETSKGLVLVVDDNPDTLALLHGSLEESGYTVLVATNGAAALKICHEINPDIVLLDAVMPEINGFEVCKSLKEDLNTRHIPVIFMTGLTESENVVAGFSAGGIDYVTKPLNPSEVIARLEAHLGNARMMSQTQNALDAFGQAAIAVLPKTCKVIWQTPFSKQLLSHYFDKNEQTGEYDLSVLQTWINALSNTDNKKVDPYRVDKPHGRLVFTAADISSDEQWLILLQEESEQAQIAALKSMFKLTNRESEVLYWATMGKTDKLIAEILGASPRTVNKHMEHVLIKMGAESRTAAASIAVNKLRSFGG